MARLKIDFFFISHSIFDKKIKMDTLIDEILHICACLSDKDNIHLSATSKRLSDIKIRILFFTKMQTDDIIHLSYFNQFSNVVMSDTNESLPKHVTHLTFSYGFNQPINACIPNSVTHLTFGRDFNQPIDSCIPDSVTHLTFGYNFNKPINCCIPDSVTYLFLGHNFNRPINGCVPYSVTYLTFGGDFDQPINGCIPESVTNLTFGYYFDQNIDDLSISIYNIELSSNYKFSISEKILMKVTRRG